MNKVFHAARLVLLILVATLLVVLPIRNTFTGNGLLSWIFQSPGTNLFLVAAAAGVLGSFLLLQVLGWRVALPILLTIYLLCSAHAGTLLPLLLLAIYAYGVVCLGRAVLRLVRAGNEVTQSFLAQLAVGVIALSAALWSFCAVGPVDLGSLRLFAVFVIGVGMACGKTPLPWGALSGRRDAATNFALAALIALFFAMLAKAQVSVDADSLWYGISGDRKLFGSGGIFSANGLVAHVNFYPKLFEMIQAPLMGTGSLPLLLGASLFCWVALAGAVSSVLEQLGVKRRWVWLATALVISTPCIANISIAAKGEVLAAWFCVAAVYFHLRWKHDSHAVWTVLALIAVAFAPLARLSVLPYAGLVFLYAIVDIWSKLRAQGGEKGKAFTGLTPAALLGGLALYVFALVNYRTLKLTGVILISPDSLIGLQHKLGLHLHDGIGRFVADFKVPFASGSYAYLLDPGQYSHLVIFWVSNAWAFLVVAAVVLQNERPTKNAPARMAQRLFLLSGVIGVIFLFAYRYTNGGADGNYFIMPVTFGLMAYFVAYGQRDDVSMSANVVSLLIGCFIVANVGWSLATVNWNRGDDELVRKEPLGTFWSRANAERGLYDQGLGDIDAILKARPGVARVVGDVDESTGAYLHASYESLETLSWAAPPLLEANGFRNFVRRNGIDFLILRTDNVPAAFSQVHAVAQSMIQGEGAVVVSRNQRFELVELNSGIWVDRNDVSDQGVFISLKCVADDQFGARIRWNLGSATRSDVSIWVESPAHAAVFARGGTSGAAEAGPWLRPSDAIVLREEPSGRIARKVRFAASVCWKQ